MEERCIDPIRIRFDHVGEFIFGLVAVDNRRCKFRFGRDIGDFGADLFPVIAGNNRYYMADSEGFRDILRNKKTDFYVFGWEESNDDSSQRDEFPFAVEIGRASCRE